MVAAQGRTERINVMTSCDEFGSVLCGIYNLQTHVKIWGQERHSLKRPVEEHNEEEPASKASRFD